ncbi:MAG: TSUP family transporter [Phycisphaerales bacterium]
MEYAVILTVALVASLLTLFSGFGLGTLLLPAFAAFFPLPLAVAMTAVVHLVNNLFKFALLGRGADRHVAARFGLPAIAGAVLGALLLSRLEHLGPVASYSISGRTAIVTWAKLVIGLLIVAFGLIEGLPATRRVEFGRLWLPLGGLVSGFFGGLSGHQGALRSAFLIRAGLSAQAFVATGVVIACLVDVTRLGVYAGHTRTEGLGSQWPIVAAASGAACLGAVLGTTLVRRVTLPMLRWIVAVGLVIFGCVMAAGIV